ncbi:MAG: hypothetical protein ACXWKV_06270 [Caulobacteraceae bacterium]
MFSTAAHAAVPGSVYCTKNVQFAARIETSGALSFGVSAWNEHGDNSFLFGIAEKRGGHWEYAKDLASSDERARCRLNIAFSLKKGASVTADSAASCVDKGGFGRLRLPAKAYQGPVTIELDDPSGFFESPRGLLGKGVCFGQKPG